MSEHVQTLPVIQLKIRLLGISPMIWRRILVPSKISLKSLHGVIQVAMGWEVHHLYQYNIYGVHYGSFDLCISSPEVAIESFQLSVNDRISYIYDMGDWWEHELRIEKYLNIDNRRNYPVCIGGSGACPPEDCGGPDGFLMRRDEATGYDAYQDTEVIADFIEEVIRTDTFENIQDEDQCWNIERALERSQSRLAFLDNKFSRRKINQAFKDNDHEIMMHQQMW